jgi:hypothetical protein
LFLTIQRAAFNPFYLEEARATLLGWTASFLFILALTWPWTRWAMFSPMEEFSYKFNGHVFFPPEGPEDRFQYFQNLVIEPGERVGYATCVLCSITVQGSVGQQATAFWGDVTVEDGGSVVQGINVSGGRITLLAGARVSLPSSAIGGSLIMEPDVKTNRAFGFSQPLLFYPGQRSWPHSGVPLFALFMLSVSACGGWLVSGSFHQRISEAARRPVRSAFFAILLFVLTLPLLFLAALSLYFFLPLTFFLYIAIPIVYWFVLAIGFAALAESIGSLLGRESPLGGRLTGAALLIALMLVPVLGLFVMLAVVLVAVGVGTAVLPWRRILYRRPSSTLPK